MRQRQSQHVEKTSPLLSAQAGGQEPFVYIVLLNWNGWRHTLDCIRSLYGLEYTNWHAIVIDNGSTDDSVERIRQAFPGVSIVENHKNLGFAAGNNIGIRLALMGGADYVLVLNNDTTVAPDSVSELVRFAENHPQAGVMGPKILRRDPQREWPIRRKLDLLTLLLTFTAFTTSTPVTSGYSAYSMKDGA